MEVGQGAAGMAAAGSTDVVAAGTGADAATTGEAGEGKKKRRKNKNRKQGGKHPSRAKRL